MDIQTSSTVITTTTKTHKAVFSADEIKNVALLTAKDKAGVADSIDSSDVVIGDDGSITVVIVETIREVSDEGETVATEQEKVEPQKVDGEASAPLAPVISAANLGG